MHFGVGHPRACGHRLLRVHAVVSTYMMHTQIYHKLLSVQRKRTCVRERPRVVHYQLVASSKQLKQVRYLVTGGARKQHVKIRQDLDNSFQQDPLLPKG